MQHKLIRTLPSHPKGRILWMIGLLICSLGWLMATPKVAAAIDSGKWARYKTANFEVYSKLREKEVAARIKDLEAFRAVVLLMTGTKDAGSFKHPTKLMLLSTQAQIASVYKVEGASGFMRPNVRSNLMVVGKHNKRNIFSEANGVVFHEYVHYLIRNASSYNYPTWYDEGFAELFSATEIDDEQARVGVIPKTAAYSITSQKPMPLTDVLAAQSTWSLPKRKRLPFYAMSWLLVHYLQFSNEARTEKLREKTLDFLQRYNRGESPEPAFEAAFGKHPEAFEEELRAYQKTNLPSYGVPFSKLPLDSTYTRTALSREEIAYEIGYQVVTRNPAYARKLFERILKSAPEDPRALAGLAVSWQMEGDYQQAQELAERALALSPDDYLLHIEMADLIGSACRQKNWTNCGFDNARQLYAHHKTTAYTLAPELLETKVGYAKALNELSRIEEAVQVLEPAHKLAPWNLEVILLLGVAHLNTGNLTPAERLLRRALGWSSEAPGLGAQIREALRLLELAKHSQRRANNK